MHILVSWRAFRFEASKEITEAQYALARERPEELQRSIREELRAKSRQAVLPTMLPAAAAVVCFVLAARFDFTNPRAWPAVIGTIVVIVGFSMTLSTVFTAGSFLYYVAAVTGFWRAMITAARSCATYPEFLVAWTQWQQARAAGSRKLPWWISWLVLAGVLLAAYFGLTQYFAK